MKRGMWNGERERNTKMSRMRKISISGKGKDPERMIRRSHSGASSRGIVSGEVGRRQRFQRWDALLWVGILVGLSCWLLLVGGHASFARGRTSPLLAPPNGPQSQPAQADDLPVARISFLYGEVSHQRRRDSTKDWDNAAINLPIEESDQLLTGDQARLEIDLGGRHYLRLSASSQLQIDKWRSGELGLALPLGTVSFSSGSSRAARQSPAPSTQSRPGPSAEPDQDLPWKIEISTPGAAVAFLEGGDYRVTVREDRGVEVIVRRGRAEAYRQELGTIAIAEGRRLTLGGSTPVSLQLGDAPEVDEWDRWHQQRQQEVLARGEVPRSLRYLDQPPGVEESSDPSTDPSLTDPREYAASSAFALAGLDDLDRYGTWQRDTNYGWIWAPRFVSTGWAPYRLGDWRWYGARGWTWVSYEPWGWLPYHYGRWTWYQDRWFWFPRGDFGPVWGGWRWSPHQVAFFGWGDRYPQGYRDGFRDGYVWGFRDGRGWIGWCPLAPGESLPNPSSPAPRSIAQLRNASLPGGISGLEGRRFTNGRVVEITGTLQVPPGEQAGARGRDLYTPLLDTREFRPDPRRSASRTALVERGEVARRLADPNTILIRREDSLVRPAPSLSRPGFDSRVSPREATRIEGGVIVRPSVPTRSSPPVRTDRQIERIDRLDRLERTPRPLEPSPRWSGRPESRTIPSRPSRTYDPYPRTNSPVERRPSARPDWGRPSAPPSRPPSPSRSAPPSSSPPAPPAPRVIERSTPLYRPGPVPERSAPATPSRPERPSRPAP